ncbi:apolipoprotein D [Leptinotarsa decemlineata]|uniref:apolipoprotein D n=1 Tax=Leptinotarsa decemlineata TaxID=7539 RepID=UPI000C253321|nr:apolipoprotein D-like [Leptinotarsa decemlineata]
MMNQIYVLAILTFTGTYAQTLLDGKCPSVNVVQNFDVEKYMGKWFEQEKYPFFHETGGKCISAEYSLNPNGTVKVLNSKIDISSGNSSSAEGNARLASDTGEAKLLVQFPSNPVKREAPYWVLSTDYNTYSIVWSCGEMKSSSIRFLWILTRERNPKKEIIEKAYAILDEQNISKTYLQKTNRENCPEER